jgi:diadenosine tetraphosphate (Ap4A) HIT family hydrolase/5-methylcytosine-specific restriction endonuclease McrA
MKFEDLKQYIITRMRRSMQHVYQPVMIKKLLQNDGRASTEEIARAILTYDQSQVEYYEQITKQMVGRILLKNGVVERASDGFALLGYERLNGEQKEELNRLCDLELENFMQKRGEKLFDHRRNDMARISGTIRYEVLKAAGFRCMLCGISAGEAFLDVDHIQPRSKQGPSDIDNYQALCFRCNRSKGNRDSADLRNVAVSYTHRDENCVFCKPQELNCFAENSLAYAAWDAFPVTSSHALIIPKRHVAGYFDLNRSELNACDRLMIQARKAIQGRDASVKGFNIGVNVGEEAGRTIFHCHLHVIQRRLGDVDAPRGGVRNLIPGKGDYQLLNTP